MPPCQPARPVPAATAARSPPTSSLSMVDMRHALQDEVDPAMYAGVGVRRRGVVDVDLEALLAQVRQEEVGGLDGLVPEPAAAHDEGAAAHLLKPAVRPLTAAAVVRWRRGPGWAAS